MAAALTIEYDEVGDILYLELVPPYPEQDSDMIGDDVIARFNPVTSAVESLEVLFFMRQLREGGRINLPVEVGIRATETDDHLGAPAPVQWDVDV
jgi:hypothetical protein